MMKQTTVLVILALCLAVVPGIAWGDSLASKNLPSSLLAQWGGAGGQDGGDAGGADGSGIDPVATSPADVVSKFPKKTIEIGLATGAVGFTTYFNENVNPGYIFNISPTLGFFIIKGLELIGSIDLTAYFGRYEYSSDRIGFTFGVKYHIELDGPFIPYFGIQMGFTIYVAVPHGTGRESFVLNIPFGVLYGLSKSVYIDVGMMGRMEEPLNTGWQTTGSISLLRVGIRVFI